MGRTSRKRWITLAGSLGAAFALLAPAAEAHHGDGLELEMAPRQLERALGAPAEPTDEDLYEIEVPGPDVLTHGPDLQLAATGASEIGFRQGDPERAPVCGEQYRQHVLYGRIAGAEDRYSASAEPIRAAMRRTNAVLNEDSLASGGPSADYRVACDGAGQIAVGTFASPDASFSSIITAARAAGYDDPNEDYTVFFDANNGGSCGIGSYYADERLSADNYNNRGGGVAVAYRSCWFNETPMHENGHNQGAVQYSAPQSTGSGGHCWEEIDVMCYSPDGGDTHQQGTVTNCADRIYFDCGFDTYFDSAPEEGEYLDSHWNIGSPLNRFISFDGGTPSTPPPAEPSPGPVSEPDPSEPPDPETAPRRSRVLHLANGHRRSGLSQTTGGWREYRIRVPRHSKALKVKLRATACAAGDCDLDLYIRRASRPSLQRFDCRRSGSGAGESCRLRAPRKGRWFVGVYSTEAAEAEGFSVRAKHRPERRHRHRGKAKHGHKHHKAHKG